jgi:ankyrin repeat protein
VVRALIEAGADNNKARVGSRTPLRIAVKKCHDAMVQFLRDAGAV